MVLHHKMSQNVKIRVNRHTNIYLLMKLFSNICDGAPVRGGPRAPKHTKSPPTRRPGCQLIRRQRLMYSTRVCSLVNLRGGWVGRGGNPPAYPPTPPPTPRLPPPPPTHLPPPPPTHLPPHPPTYTPPTHPQLASSSTDTFKQRENQNKEKLTKVATYEL